MNKEGKIIIFSPSKDAYSETFIQAHRKLNDGKVIFIHGAYSSLKNDDGSLLISKSFKYLLKGVTHLLKSTKAKDVDFEIKRLFKKNIIKGVLVEYGTHAAYIIPYLAKYNIPIITHFHGYDASMYNTIKEYKEKYQRVVFQYSDAVVGVSNLMCQMLKDLGCPEEKVIYNVYGPDPKFANLTRLLEGKKLLAIGRFVDKKAPYYLILVMKKVVERHPDAVLEIAGDGALKDACVNLVNYFGLEKNVLFLGKTSPETLVEKMTKASAFVQHSLTPSSGDKEGTPLSILEATAAGVPVIATKHAGIQDVVVDGETGYLCDEHDVDGMADHLSELLSDQGRLISMGTAGKERAKRHFTQERHLEELDKLFNK